MDAQTISSIRFSVASPQIVWQSFDDELILINLESGIYYSLNDSAATIWSLMESGCTPAESVELALDGAKSPASCEGIIEFWEGLIAEGLIAPRANANGIVKSVPAIMPVTPAGEWESPSLRKYGDMQDLLLLDPIHDVSEEGWPASREGGAATCP